MDIDGILYCSKCMRRLEEEGICPHCGYDSDNTPSDCQYLSEGTFLKDRYLLGTVINTGGFGVTYAAWDINLNVPVAIKEYYPVKYAHRDTEKADDVLCYAEGQGLFALGLDRFRQEAQVLAQFKNIPGVVNINECFDENNTSYIVMEYVHGVPLDEYVQVYKPAPRTLLQMMLQPIRALEIIHRQGVHHRDITPANLLVQEDGSIKLIDFGSAREIEHTTNLIVVSDGYAPVEQYDTQRPQGPWGDIYSISATLYHMLTGVMPPAAISRTKHDSLKKPSELGVKLKRYQERALMAGLAVDPEKRIRSIEEFRALLYNMPLPEEVRRRRAFMRRVCAGAAAVVLMMAAVMLNFTCGLPLGSGLLYALYPDGFHVMGAMQENENVSIPQKLCGIPVTHIQELAFEGNEKISTLFIPGSIKQMGPMSFANCSNIRTVTIAEGVTALPSHAFFGCGQLHTVMLPDSMESIADNAFAESWERMTLCAKTGSYVQKYAQNQGIGFYDPEQYMYRLVEGAGVELIQGPYNRSGEQTNLDEYIIPSFINGHPVLSLGEDFAFPSGCRKIKLPMYLQKLPKYCFEDLYYLEQVDFGQNLQGIPDMAFMDLQGIHSIELPATVETIGHSAFSTVPLREIKLSDSLKSIDDNAFYYTQLNEIELPSQLEVIGHSAFLYTPLFSVNFPESIKEIGSFAFCGTNVNTVSLAIDLDYLGMSAFADSEKIRDVYLYGRNDNPSSPSSGILAESCFADGLHYNVSLMGHVKEIGARCFANAKELSFVSLPEGLEIIGKEAFANCGFLNQVIIPDSVRFIDETAFADCGTFKIIGSEGSYAQQYAEEHDLIFVPGLDLLKEKYGGVIPDADALPFFMPGE